MKIHANTVTKKPTLVDVKFDDDRAGRTLIQTSGNSFARENDSVPIEPVLSKIKGRPGKSSSPEVEGIQMLWSVLIYKKKGFLTMGKCMLH